MTLPIQSATPNPLTQSQPDSRLREVAKELEASFLSEMLKHTGLGQSRQSFGGGAGEDQFSSLLIDAQAKAMVDAGGIGLAESIFENLKEKANG